MYYRELLFSPHLQPEPAPKEQRKFRYEAKCEVDNTRLLLVLLVYYCYMPVLGINKNDANNDRVSLH